MESVEILSCILGKETKPGFFDGQGTCIFHCVQALGCCTSSPRLCLQCCGSHAPGPARLSLLCRKINVEIPQRGEGEYYAMRE